MVLAIQKALRFFGRFSSLSTSLLLIFSNLILMNGPTFAAEKDYWAETGLSDQHLIEFLSQKRCYSNETSFVGCIDAINSLLNHEIPKKTLTNKSIENMPIMGSVVANIQRLKIQNSNTSQTSTSQDAEAIRDSWKSVYQLTFLNPLSIKEIAEKALSYTSQSKRSLKISNAINAYYQTAIDPHTHIISIAERDAAQKISENIIAVGIGVKVLKVNDSIVMNPINGSAAFAAGIKPKDVLLSVDGEDVTNSTIDDVVKKIKGDENTKVSITVLRKQKKLTFQIAREKVIQKNVEVQVMNDPIDGSNIGYIKIRDFTKRGVCQQFMFVAIALRRDWKAKSLVLDLRNNPGGLVSEAICISSSYIDKGSVILTENNYLTNAVQHTYRDSDPASLYNLYDRKPLVILINAASASASEIVSGALRSQGRAILVGERSFGKGTMQAQLPWKENGVHPLPGIAIMQTSVRFHFSNGESNQLLGLVPDIEASSGNDSPVMREKDLYPNAIPEVPHKPYTPDAHAQKIENCIHRRNMLNSPFADKINSHLVPDYQMSIAREAASCL